MSLYEGPKMRNLQMTMITAVDLLNECAQAHSDAKFCESEEYLLKFSIQFKFKVTQTFILQY